MSVNTLFGSLLVQLSPPTRKLDVFGCSYSRDYREVILRLEWEGKVTCYNTECYVALVQEQLFPVPNWSVFP